MERTEYMEQKRTMLPWRLLSKYRAPLMGIAMIGVYLTHYKKAFSVNRVTPVPWIVNQLRYGSSGVDIFLILSGLGLCYSFAKDSSLLHFYRKRLVRLLPAYLITQALYYIMLLVKTGHVDNKQFFRKMFFIDFFTKGDASFWFIIAILLCYLIFPLVYKMMELTKIHVLNLVICAVLYVFLHMLLWRYDRTLYLNTIALVQRIPAFVFGVWIGRECLDDRKFHVIIIPLFWAFTAVVLFRSKIPFFPKLGFSLYDFSLTLVGMSLIFLFVLLFEWLQNAGWMKQCIRFLSFLGGITLECYLMHSLLKWWFFSPVEPLAYLVTCCVIPTIAAWILHKICLPIVRKLS